ncbi:MAG: hypothetical protein AAFV59_09480 [Pseudomonadota bacterium]
MLPRRVAKHVKARDWAAVLLDFVIVVAGVFIGIQLGNWNDDRQTRQSFYAAQNRVLAETRANLETTEQYLIDVDARLAQVRTGISALRSCQESESARQAVIDGAQLIRGTLTLRLRKTALTAITGNDNFLSLLLESEREELKEFQRQLEQTQSTLDWLEARPFTNHIENHPFVEFGELESLPSIDGVQLRKLVINQPMAVICEHEAFSKSFYLWERTATFQTIRADQLRTRLLEMIRSLDEE